MNREDFEQNNEHGGYPIVVQLERNPFKPWLIGMVAFGAVCLVMIILKLN